MERRTDITLKLHDFASIRLSDVPASIAERIEQYFRKHLVRNTEDDTYHSHIVFSSRPKFDQRTVHYVSRHAAFNEEEFFIRDRHDKVFSFRTTDGVDLSRIDVDDQFAPDLFVTLLELVLHTISMLQQRVFLHSSAVGVNGKALVMCAWANTGKSEVLCELLRRGHTFMGDDWCILSPQGWAYAYLKATRLYRHDLLMAPYILRQRFGWRAELLIHYLGLLSPSKLLRVSISPLHRIQRSMLRRIVRLLRVNVTELTLDPEEISPAGLTLEAPLGAVFFLTRSTVDDIEILQTDPGQVAKRMTSVYAWETHLTIDDCWLRFAFPGKSIAFPDIHLDQMETVLRTSLAHAPVYWVRVPVDCSPQQVADRLLEKVLW